MYGTLEPLEVKNRNKDNLDDGSLSNIAVLMGLIAVHGFIVLGYAALSNSRPAALRELAQEGNRRAGRALRLTESLPRLHIAAQLILTLIRFTIAALATVNVANALAAASPSVLAANSPVLAYVAMLLPVALLTYIVGELVPEAIGSAYPESLALPLSFFQRLLLVGFSPVAGVLHTTSVALARRSGLSDITKEVSDEEIMTLVDVGERGGVIESEEKEMIRSVLQFGETLAREVMVSRLDMVALDTETSVHEARRTILESGHSRIPIYEDNIDNVKGLLYAKDLLHDLGAEDGQKTVRDLIRPAYFVPETKTADSLFKEMQGRKVHMAILVDEYGATSGIVTIEDLIEEIVGDIQDEYDLHEEEEVVQHGENQYTIDATMNLHDFNDLMKTDLPTEDTDTLGGYVFAQLGRLPRLGETVETENLLLVVESVEGRRIRKIRVARRQPEVPNEETREETRPQPGLDGLSAVVGKPAQT
jgi:putative hemolysin